MHDFIVMRDHWKGETKKLGTYESFALAKAAIKADQQFDNSGDYEYSIVEMVDKDGDIQATVHVMRDYRAARAYTREVQNG